VRNSLQALTGVKQVEVDLDEATAIVVFKNAEIDISGLIKATTDIGFPAALKQGSE